MGNSNSTPENNFTEIQTLKNILARNTETFGGGDSETSIVANYTDNKSNLPYYKEYMQAKQKYLKLKNQKSNKSFSGGDSETSIIANYTESNAHLPHYKEYIETKQKYLNMKKNIQLGSAGTCMCGNSICVCNIKSLNELPSSMINKQLSPELIRKIVSLVNSN
jgi:hypothetical protein